MVREATIDMTLSQVAGPLGAQHLGADARFEGVSTDTRSLASGDLFVALRGAHHDGHAFVHQAENAGAVGALVSHPPAVDLPLLVVSDTRHALGQLAGLWRERLAGPLVAVTGSNGKTTVKEMLAAILVQCGPVLATQGNLNNDVGLPLTLFRLTGDEAFAVVEMGANHPGEIAWLTQIARPNVAVITNAGPAHLEGFGSVEGVARAKGELFAGLGAEATAVINADDAHAPLWRAMAGSHPQISFGLDQTADVTAEYTPGDGQTGLTLHTPWGSADTELGLPGRHNVMNALAAAAAALVAGASLAAVSAGLANLRALTGRLVGVGGIRGTRIIDDTYNANPGSLAAALDVLGRAPDGRWLILGDMAELGPEAAHWHAQAGEAARSAGVHRVFGLGELGGQAAEAFGTGGQAFATVAELTEALWAELQGGETLLVKGSRSMGMERVVAALRAPDGGEAGR